MLAIGSPITSIHLSTTCTSLLKELEQIWNDIGETEKDKDRMLMELERECLDVYRRKVDEAANTKARFHQSVAAKEAEIATLMAALGEHDIHSPVKADKRSASLKEKLASVTPLVEELKKKKEERLKQFADIKTQIEKISGEICGIHTVGDDLSSTGGKDEQDLSLRRLNEYQTHLRSLQKEKSDRLQKVLQCVNEVHSLCGVLGLDFGQTVEDVHPSLHGTQVEQSTNISDSTLEGLEKTILKLKTERKVRVQKLKDIVANLFELWNLMDTSKEERNTFLRITSIVATSPSEITERGGLSTDVIEKASAEVEKLAKLKASRMKELVFKKRSELEEICRLTHIEPDTSTAAEKASALIDSGLVDPCELLANIEAQIVKAKDEALSRRDVTDRIDKWLFACEEENWLDEYSQDDNRYSAGRGAHINLKRAERARVTVTKIPAMVDNLISKTLAWEDEKKTCFLYDGVRLVELLDDYKLTRQQREEVKRRQRMSSSSSSQAQAKEQDDSIKPLWQYVTKIKKTSAGGGNSEIQCHLCKITFSGSYTRVRAHLLKISGQGVKVCKKVTTDKLLDLTKMDNEYTLKMERLKTKPVSLPPISSAPQDSSTLNITVEPKKRKTSTLEAAFNLQSREELDYKIARMFYSAGLPFHLARNPHFREAFSYAANNSIPGYQPPSYNKLRTTLLQNERNHVENLLQSIKSTWNQKGVTIVSDGWSDPQRRPLINFMAVTESGPMFLKAVNCFNEVKDREFIAKCIREVIMEVGPSNVVQVVTDNAPVCKAAGLIIEAEFPSIYWTPCVVHTLNLALKNICAAKDTEKNSIVYKECSWITRVADDAIFIKNFVMGHSMRLSIFTSFSPLKLLSVASTRFASTIVMLRRFKLLKTGLQQMVISEQWSSYKDDDVQKAQFVKDTLLDDNWWEKVDYILSFTNPIYDVLRRTDTEASCLHLVYEMWDSMIEDVRKAIYTHEGISNAEISTFHQVVHAILIDRWTKSSTPLHCLAHSLNPRYYSIEWLSEDPNRVPPHQDIELTDEREKCFRRLFPDANERRTVNIEFANFSDGREGFGNLDAIVDRDKMDPKTWWLVHGARAPLLQKVALKLLAQPCSSSCCERNWSTYSFIHSLKRNKMAPHRAEALVFVHSNLRLLSRNTPQYHQEETKMWDVAGDEFGSLDDSGFLEVANLSLDEPGLEAGFINNI